MNIEKYSYHDNKVKLIPIHNYIICYNKSVNVDYNWDTLIVTRAQWIHARKIDRTNDGTNGQYGSTEMALSLRG